MIKEWIINLLLQKYFCTSKASQSFRRHLESIKCLSCCEQLATKTEKGWTVYAGPSALLHISLYLSFNLSQESEYHIFISTPTWNKSECLIIAVPLSFCHKDEVWMLNIKQP